MEDLFLWELCKEILDGERLYWGSRRICEAGIA